MHAGPSNPARGFERVERIDDMATNDCKEYYIRRLQNWAYKGSSYKR